MAAVSKVRLMNGARYLKCMISHTRGVSISSNRVFPKYDHSSKLVD